jgi:hypothetical protein
MSRTQEKIPSGHNVKKFTKQKLYDLLSLPQKSSVSSTPWNEYNVHISYQQSEHCGLSLTD